MDESEISSFVMWSVVTGIVGDKTLVNLAKKQAQSFNELAENGNVPNELMMSDVDYWTFLIIMNLC